MRNVSLLVAIGVNEEGFREVFVRCANSNFLLPSFSPELDPDELLNQYVKTNALGLTPFWVRTGSCELTNTFDRRAAQNYKFDRYGPP